MPRGEVVILTKVHMVVQKVRGALTVHLSSWGVPLPADLHRRTELIVSPLRQPSQDPKSHPSKLKDPNSRDYVNAHGLSRKHIFDSVKASLERMDVSSPQAHDSGTSD
jgi:aryl-alcohol dehydrogenase-like predicted oxidoreductase